MKYCDNEMTMVVSDCGCFLFWRKAWREYLDMPG